MSDFERTHELKRLWNVRPGWIAECHCGRPSGWRRLAFFAVMDHYRHRSETLKAQQVKR